MRTLLFWPLFCAAFAYLQGILLPAIRRTPPGVESNNQAFALHVVGSVVYLLPLVFTPTIVGVAICLGSRLALFDPVLNRAAGRPWLEVGQTAFTDKLLRRLGSDKPERVSLLVRIGGCLVLAVVVWLAA